MKKIATLFFFICLFNSAYTQVTIKFEEILGKPRQLILSGPLNKYPISNSPTDSIVNFTIDKGYELGVKFGKSNVCEKIFATVGELYEQQLIHEFFKYRHHRDKNMTKWYCPNYNVVYLASQQPSKGALFLIEGKIY